MYTPRQYVIKCIYEYRQRHYKTVADCRSYDTYIFVYCYIIIIINKQNKKFKPSIKYLLPENGITIVSIHAIGILIPN